MLFSLTCLVVVLALLVFASPAFMRITDEGEGNHMDTTAVSMEVYRALSLSSSFPHSLMQQKMHMSRDNAMAMMNTHSFTMVEMLHSCGVGGDGVWRCMLCMLRLLCVWVIPQYVLKQSHNVVCGLCV